MLLASWDDEMHIASELPVDDSLSMASENPASAEAIHVGVDKFHGTCKWHAK